jgi:formate dehydrogenase accessory protein FdhD
MDVTEVLVNRFDIKKGIKTKTSELVVSEETYQINVNDTEVALVSASSGMMKELAVGYVVGGGFLRLNDITDITATKTTITITTKKDVDITIKHIRSSDCSSHWVSESVAKEGIITSTLTVPAPVIGEAVSLLQSHPHIWRKTHAVHSAALFTGDGTLLKLVEDVSRHNAFDKVIGWALLNNYDFSLLFAGLSGRITKDMVIKAGNMGIPIIASRSTVIEPAVTVASALGVTLIGYVRKSHLVVFSHAERIL